MLKQLHLKSLFLLMLLMVGSGSAWADEVTFTAGTDTGDASVTKDGITVSMSTMSRTDNYRTYANTDMKITSAVGNITKVELTATASGTASYGPGKFSGSGYTYSGNKGTWEGSAETVTLSASAQVRMTEIKVTYTSVQDTRTKVNITSFTATKTSLAKGETTTTSVANDQAGWTAAYTYASDKPAVATVDENGVITATGYGKANITVNPNVDKEDENFKAGEGKSLEITVLVPKHTAKFSVNGTATEEEFEEGAAIVFPADPADVDGLSFQGWVTTAITGTTDGKPEFVSAATMGEEDVTFYAVFATVTGNSEQTIDAFDNTQIGRTTYGDWKDVKVSSDAVYAGNSTTGSGETYIQIRSSNSNSGIVTTTSGGKAVKVAVEWNSGTTDGRTLDIYGKNTAYSKASDLYDSNKQGTKIGSIVCGTSTELKITGDYEYIGLRSNNGAMYLDKLSITWETGSSVVSGYCTTVTADNRAEAGISFAEAAVTKEITESYTGQTLTNPNNVSPITWASSKEDVATVENGVVTLKAVGETTITAKFAGNDDYKAAVASYTLTVQDSRTALSLSFAEETVSVNVNEKVAAPALSGNAGNGAVSYKSENEAIATVNAETGEVTGVADGTTTITATVAATNEYKAGTATFTVKVVDPNKKGTETNPYTVAEARAAIDANEGVTGVYAKGIVSEIVTPYSSQFGNITYNISADGSVESDQLQAYRGKGKDGANFTSSDDIQVGDVVVVYGDLQLYGETYEFAANNQLVSLERVEKAEPELSFGENNEFTVNIGEDFTAPTLSNPHGLTVTYSSSNENVAVVDETTGEILLDTESEGTVTITASFAGNDEYKAGSAEYTITVVDPNKTEEVFTLGVALGLSNGDVFESQSLASGTVIASKASGNNAPKFYTSDNTTRVYASNKITIASSTKAIKSVTFSLEQGDELEAENADYVGENLTWTAMDGKAVNTVVFSVTGTVRINSITVAYTDIAPVTVAISDAKYATFASANTVDFSETGITAYTAKYNSETSAMKLVEVEDGIVPANTAVVLYAEQAKEYQLQFAIPSAQLDTDLKVSDGTVTGGATIFALANNDNYGVGFYNVAATVTIPAGKAYLEIPAGAGVRNFIGFESETTGIGTIAASKAANAVFNMQGQRVAAPAKGLYIMNGKKVVIK